MAASKSAPARRATSGQGKAKSQRVRKGHPATSAQMVYSQDQTEFLRAIERYQAMCVEPEKRRPGWPDVLRIVQSLGYTPAHAGKVDEAAFRHALDMFEIKTGRRFPTWCDILDVIVSLGLEKGGRARTKGGRR